MSLVAIPNVSEGRDPRRVASLASVTASGGAAVLDVHSDALHHRSVLTTCAEPGVLPAAMTALAAACAAELDLTRHEGRHPRLGSLDVCPFVYTDDPGGAILAAQETARRIGDELDLPCLLYGAAARTPERRELPDLRRGGLERWVAAFADGEMPDEGPARLDPRTGIVCVGARPPLIAFNVWLKGGAALARSIAQAVRETGGGLPGVRAIGIDMDEGWSQVSMNLTRPEITGIDDAFDAIAAKARKAGVEVFRGEIVGVPLERFMPHPEREAARWISPPGRSLESLLPDR
jgi:glutamate formiminotransferase